jgi:4-amino-4-deoxy-L-arabinose transferase-like glycosyltransferase
MKHKREYHYYLLALMILCALLVTVSDLDYNSIFVDEAFHIVVGHQVLRGEACPSCPYVTGSIFIHPIIAAFGDMMGGLHGARFMNTLLGLLSALFVYLTARLLFNRRTGLIAFAVFIFSGQALYLMKLATYDMAAVFFLSLAFLLVVASERAASELGCNLLLLAGTVALFAASITKYLVPVFIPAFMLFILWRLGFWRALYGSFVPLAALLIVYYLGAVYPVREGLFGTVENSRVSFRVPFVTLFDWTIRWIALALLLAVFGLFRRGKGRAVLVLIGMSTPILLVHLLSGAEQSLNKNVIFSLVFLAPAGALGVNHLASIFSMRSDSRAVRSFFTVTILIIAAVYGLHNLNWLEKQYPNVDPVIEFFRNNGHDGMTVVSNGYDDLIYRYSLPEYPNARYLHITSVAASAHHANGAATGTAGSDKADFILCMDTYYGKQFPCTDYDEYIDDDYELLTVITMPLSWGSTDAKILGRR